MLSACSGDRVFGKDVVLDSTSISLVLCGFLETYILFGGTFVWSVVSLGCDGPVVQLFPIQSQCSGHWVQLEEWFMFCLPFLLQ